MEYRRMTNFANRLFALSLVAAAMSASAQEPWDPHLKLTAGQVIGIDGKNIGQDKTYGLVFGGAYPLTASGWGVAEFGYRFLPTASTDYGLTTIDDKSDVYYASLMYRHQLWRHGIYVQGGIRGTNAKTTRRYNYSESWERVNADRETRAGWCFAAGYRLTDRWSAELGASSIGFKNVPGEVVTGTIIEAALVIHR
jgi:hypothetical protein